MNVEILAAVIGPVITLLGTIAVTAMSHKRHDELQDQTLKTLEAYFREKLDDLKIRVDNHNHFDRRVNTLETVVQTIDKRLTRTEEKVK